MVEWVCAECGKVRYRSTTAYTSAEDVPDDEYGAELECRDCGEATEHFPRDG